MILKFIILTSQPLVQLAIWSSRRTGHACRWFSHN